MIPAPRQGDHVFNSLETAVMRPFDVIASLQSPHVSGQYFIYDYLLHSYSLAKQTAESPALTAARRFAATASGHESAQRLLASLRSRYPSLTRVSGAMLQTIHTQNAEQFGAAVTRFELEFLTALYQALEKTMAANGPKAPGFAPNPGIAYQQMLDSAYDPAAALAVIASSAAREDPAVQGQFHGVVVAIADTLDRPGMWKDPYLNYRGGAASATGGAVQAIGDALLQLDSLKAPGVTFTVWARDEIANHARASSPKTESDFGAMLSLLYRHLQQM